MVLLISPISPSDISLIAENRARIYEKGIGNLNTSQNNVSRLKLGVGLGSLTQYPNWSHCNAVCRKYL